MQNQRWFKKEGWIYLPVHRMGYFVIIMAIIFIVPVIMAIARNGHAVSDELCENFCLRHMFHIFMEMDCR